MILVQSPAGVEFVAGDVMKLDSMMRVMEKVETVIHLAADMDFFPSNPDAMYTVRLYSFQMYALDS